MSLKIIKRRVAMVTTNTAKLNDFIHDTAVMIVDHAREHGDSTQALALCLAMPKSYRRSMLVNWFTLVSPINVNIPKETVSLRKPDAKQYAFFDMDKANAVKWFELEPEKKETGEPATLVTQVYDSFTSFIERMEKKIINAKDEDDAIKATLLADLKRALEAFHNHAEQKIEEVEVVEEQFQANIRQAA